MQENSYPLHPSNCLFVGCELLGPSPGLTPAGPLQAAFKFVPDEFVIQLPPRCILNDFVYSLYLLT
ncbi:hypothetical protein EVX99_15305 [Citrobacter koseri]|nr:hypothetical protein EVX99_15305 [Citrobacter koseri]